MKKAFVFAAAVAAILCSFGAGRFDVKGCAVVYEDAFERTQGERWGLDAAKDLARILSQVTGSEVKAYPEAKAPKDLARVIGLGKVAAAKDVDTSGYEACEFRVRVTPTCVTLVGRTETACSYAMTEFLERFCGYRFLSQNGEDPYAVNPSLSVAPCDFTRKPAIPNRLVYRCYVNRWINAKDMPKTAGNFFAYQRQRRLRMREEDYDADFRVRRIDHSDCHLIYKYLMPTKYFKDHPEWYCMDANGNRCGIMNGGCQLCYTNPEMRDEFAKNLLAMIEADKAANPTNYARVYDMGQGDSSTRLCFCPNCTKAMDRYNRVKGGNWEGGDCGLQLDFANDMMRRVRAKHPEIKLRIFAYVSSEERPRDLPVEKGVIPWFCDLYTFSDHMIPLTHPMNKVKLDNLKDWVANAEYVKLWDYMLYGSTPEVNADAIKADAMLFRDLGLKDIFMETEFLYQPFYDLHLYLFGQLYFDPDLDVEKLIDEWIVVYGKAAPKMREAIDFLRELERTQLPADLPLWHARRLPWYTVENFERLRAMFREAYAMDESPAVRQRIAIAISGTDEKLMELYRGLWGKDAELDAAREEYVRTTKEWATYENTDPAKIAVTVKKIEERVLLDNLQFKDIPPELKDVPKNDLKCIDWRGRRISITHVADSEIEDDPDSEVGKAAVLHFRQPGRVMKLPIEGGVWDNGVKKVLKHVKLEVPEANLDGRYHWYNLGTVTIGQYSTLWFHGTWGIQYHLNHLFVLCDGAPVDLNTYEMWVSLKVVGKEAFNFDRGILRRIVKEK